jgi:hypothetical protein
MDDFFDILFDKARYDEPPWLAKTENRQAAHRAAVSPA